MDQYSACKFVGHWEDLFPLLSSSNESSTLVVGLDRKLSLFSFGGPDHVDLLFHICYCSRSTHALPNPKVSSSRYLQASALIHNQPTRGKLFFVILAILLLLLVPLLLVPLLLVPRLAFWTSINYSRQRMLLCTRQVALRSSSSCL